MKKKYYQLTPEQRYQIQALINEGFSQTYIADKIGCHKSTISRELQRNIPQRGKGAKIYVAQKAQAKAELRHAQKSKSIAFTDQLKTQAFNLLKNERFSPEFISAHWKKKNIDGVSHETIYKFIWECKHTNKRKNKKFKTAYRYLKHGKRRRKRGNYTDTRGNIPNRVPIDKRPKVVQQRKRVGDIEVDLIMGKNHQSALLVTVDRATLHTTISKLKGKNAGTISKKITKRLKSYNMKIHTITFDNDKAFVFHETIAKELNAKAYFTRPYTSQDKGTIENRNGVIRLFFPKKTDFNTIAYKEIKRVETKINNRPIRKFNYLSANEMMLKLAG